MFNEFKKLICALCEKECLIVLDVKISGDTAWPYNSGICSTCFREVDLDEKVIFKYKAFIQSQIDDAKSKQINWERELEKANNTLSPL